MRRVISLVMVSATMFACSNEKLQLQPNWKKGDKKEVETVSIYSSDRGGEVKEEEAEKNSFTIEVLDVTDEKFVVHLKTANKAMQSAINSFNQDTVSFDAYKMIELNFEVTRNGKESKLINAKELVGHINMGLDEVLKAAEVKGELDLMTKLLKSVRDRNSTEKGIEENLKEELNVLLLPFREEFIVAGEVVSNGTVKNPFDSKEKIKSTTKIVAKLVDDNSLELKYTTNYELESFVKEMKERIKKRGGYVAENVDQLEIDLIETKSIILDKKSNWPSKIEVIQTSNTTGPDGEKERSITKTTTVVE